MHPPDSKTASSFATSIVHSKLDYCNSLYHNLPKSQIARLQQIQNSLARAVVKAPKTHSVPRSHSIGGGTGFLIRQPFTQLPISVPDFSSFESSSITLQLPQSKLSVFNIYRPPSSSAVSKPFSVFLDEFSSFLSFAATTPHEFLITGDFNIHLDNPTDHLTSQFLSLLSTFNLTQHVDLSLIHI